MLGRRKTWIAKTRDFSRKKRTICHFDFLADFTYEPVGRGFESLPAYQRKRHPCGCLFLWYSDLEEGTRIIRKPQYAGGILHFPVRTLGNSFVSAVAEMQTSPFRRTKKQPIFDENGLFFCLFLRFFLHLGSKNEGKENPWRKFGANHQKNGAFGAKQNKAKGKPGSGFEVRCLVFCFREERELRPACGGSHSPGSPLPVLSCHLT